MSEPSEVNGALNGQTLLSYMITYSTKIDHSKCNHLGQIAGYLAYLAYLFGFCKSREKELNSLVLSD